MNRTIDEIEYEKIDWGDVFMTMEAEIKQLRKENEQLKAQIKSKKTITSIKDLAIEIQNEMEELQAKKTVLRPDYFSRSDNYSKYENEKN
jgi:hypothetical protein